jgi:type IV secretion system protein VirB4
MDLLPWDVVVGDGLVANADGALMATVSYRGPDPASSTHEDLLALSRNLLQAFRGLGDGWLLHFDLHRLPAPDYPAPGPFPDAYTRALDADRREAYQARRSHYLSQQFLTLTHHPGGGERRSPLDTLLQPDVDDDSLAGQIRDFENALDEILGTLGAVWRIERLDTPAMLEYLYRCLTFRQQPLRVPTRTPYTLEHLFGAGDLYGGTDLRFAEQHIIPIRFAGFPDSVGPASLDFLNDLPLPFRSSFRYIPLDPQSARSAIKHKRANWNTAGVGWRQALAVLFGSKDSSPSFTERFAPAMAQDADDALLELESSQTSAGYLTSVFFTSSPDREEAQALARRLLKHLRNAGFAAAAEDLNALDAYLGALPGVGRVNVRRPMLTLRALVNLAPSTTVWAGEPHHPHPELRGHPPTIIAATSGSTPFAFSSAVGDVQHAVVIGPTGAGKSVLLNLLLAQYFRYPRSQVFSLDKGYSQLALATAAGGSHYDLTADPQAPGAHRFAPLEHLDTAADFQRAIEWTLALLEIAGLEPTPILQRTVTNALRDLQHTSAHTLATFAIKAQSNEIRDALDPYVLDGPYSHLFDGASSLIRESRFSVFEMEPLLPLRQAVVTPLVLHLFSEIERRLDGSPTLIAVEELAGYLHRPLFARRFAQYLLELRKKNAGLLMVNQNVTALLDSPLRSALVESTPTKIFLPNPAATEPSVRDAYRSIGLNDRQIEIICEATPKRDYYVTTPLGARLFQLDLSPAALSILGIAGPTARQAIAEARATWGSDWLPRYLSELGHNAFAELLAPDQAA